MPTDDTTRANREAADLLLMCAGQAVWICGCHTMARGMFSDSVRWRANAFLSRTARGDGRSDMWRESYARAAALALRFRIAVPRNQTV